MVLFKSNRTIIFIIFILIYIPLWSYSNTFTFTIPVGVFKFTFHYGPIQMIIPTPIFLSLNEFTFHYGPIQIKLTHFYVFWCLNLHSTMVLFKFQCWTIHNFMNFFIYIPLWSYSNCEFCYHKNEWKRFTFHYGPIQIFFHKIWIRNKANIYIPLCSYSNSEVSTFSVS